MVKHGSVPDEELLAAALEARGRAYAPYSKFQVGAAVLGASGRVHTGCNVECASYPLTCCAERVAIYNAISAGETAIVGIAVMTDTDPAAGPCGACRQVIAEFGPAAFVLIGSTTAPARRTTIAELLPDCFDGAQLRR